LRSRIPVTYPLRAVQFPTARLNENVSPGRDEEAVDVGAGETEVDDLVLLQIDLVGSELATQQRRVLADAHGKGLTRTSRGPTARAKPPLEATASAMHPHGDRVESGPALRQPRRTSQQLLNPAPFELRDFLDQLPRHDRSHSTQFQGDTQRTSAESGWLQ